MKVVLNCRYGGFGLSKRAVDRLRSLGYTGDVSRIPRNLPELVKIVEELGNDADGDFSRLYVEDVEDDWNGAISDYDGKERVGDVYSSTYVPLITPAEIERKRTMDWLWSHVDQPLTATLIFELEKCLKG